MPRKIKVPVSVKSGTKKAQNEKLIPNTPIETYLAIIHRWYPHKLNFSIDETAKVIEMSYDFIWARIQKGMIAAVKYGDIYKINRSEVARILSQGVN